MNYSGSINFYYIMYYTEFVTNDRHLRKKEKYEE